MESQLEQPVKGLSKGFVAYKKQLNNPDEAELKFQGFIHEAAKRREQQKIDLVKKKQKDAIKMQEEKEQQKAKTLSIFEQQERLRKRKAREKKFKKKQQNVKLIGSMFLRNDRHRTVHANKDNFEYYNKIYED